MAIISKIGSSSLKVRALYFAMYAFLIAGSLTMIYPFLLMIAGSTKSAVDVKFMRPMPAFYGSDVWLYRKHMEALFNDRVTSMTPAYDTDDVSFETILPPGLDQAVADAVLVDAKRVAEAKAAERTGKPVKARPVAEIAEELEASWAPEEHVNRPLIAAAEAFLAQADLPPHAYTIGHLETPITKTIPGQLRRFKHWLREHFGDDIDVVNKQIGTEYIAWNWVAVPAEQYLLRREKPRDTAFQKALNEFKSTTPGGMRYYFSADGCYKKMFLKSRYGTGLKPFNPADHATYEEWEQARVKPYNDVHGTAYRSWSEIHLPRRLPENAKEAVDWTAFVRSTVALHYLRADDAAFPLYVEFLKAKHRDLATLNKHYETSYARWDDLGAAVEGDPLHWLGDDEPPYQGMALSDWEAFISGWEDPDMKGKVYQLPVEMVYIVSLETRFQDYLLAQHGTLEKINAALGTDYAAIDRIQLPQRQMHFAWFLENRGDLRWDFTTRNYKTVAEYLLFHGRGIFNTVVYCVLAIMAALLVNPLAAYAMSRFKMPSSYKILLFLLCTMAFPPMVTSIPNFLMLRQFGLLNTFAALILPGLANGYAIFLLKGFFDAQPQELYESAQLDGASEWVLFWQIAMSLSKPILAVIALQAFNHAYSNFMFAFVVCQDEKMWTLMVWLYQLQQKMGQPVMYASLIIAAIPTFLIFLFCQNIIMRGIVVPSEK